MSLSVIDAGAVARVPGRAIVDALDQAFGAGLASAPARTAAEIDGGQMLLMPAADGLGSGVKLLTLLADNPGRELPFVQGVHVLFGANGSPVSVIDAAALTAVRTAAVSAVAARRLAPRRGGTVMVFGTGVQARSHVELVTDELAPVRVLVCGRRAEAVAEVVEWAALRGITAEPAAPERVAEADVICTCTSSQHPLFAGALLRPGTLVIAVGAYRPDMRELDSRTVMEAAIVVEQVDAALAEAGDLLIPIGRGELARDRVRVTLTDVVRGAEVRDAAERTVVFKSVGVAGEDLAAARAIVAWAGQPGRAVGDDHRWRHPVDAERRGGVSRG